MSTLLHSNNRTPKSGRQTLFFHDLATPISAASSSRAKFSTPSQAAAAVSSLWRENLGSSGARPDLPPPPVFTLDDHSDFSPELGLPDSPSSSGPTKLQLDRSGSRKEVATPVSARVREGGSPVSSSWWLTTAVSGGGGGEEEDNGKGSPVEGVLQPPGLLMLPPPREVARPEMAAKRNSALPAGRLEEEEWITVYGFSYADTNLIFREFEKCGVILKHIPGPREANWMHILYQSRSDAEKALGKNGMHINRVLIIGVKPVDPTQQQALNERLNNQGFMTLPPLPSGSASELNPSRSAPHPYYLPNGSSSARQQGGAVASPAKSAVSKVFDVMFGI